MMQIGIRLASLAGARLILNASLTAEQIQWQQCLIRVKGKGGPFGKRSKNRVVPMSLRVRSLLEPYFVLNQKRFVGSRAAQKIVKRKTLMSPTRCLRAECRPRSRMNLATPTAWVTVPNDVASCDTLRRLKIWTEEGTCFVPIITSNSFAPSAAGESEREARRAVDSTGGIDLRRIFPVVVNEGPRGLLTQLLCRYAPKFSGARAARIEAPRRGPQSRTWSGLNRSSVKRFALARISHHRH